MDLSKESFYDTQGAVQHLYTIMATGGSETRFGNFSSFKIDKIDSHSPNSIETTSEILKMYPGKHGFKLTIDTQMLTYIVDVSTEELNYTLSTIEKPSISAPLFNSNSFIFANRPSASLEVCWKKRGDSGRMPSSISLSSTYPAPTAL